MRVQASDPRACELCVEAGDVRDSDGTVPVATWERDDPGIRTACGSCKATCDAYDDANGLERSAWRRIASPAHVCGRDC